MNKKIFTLCFVFANLFVINAQELNFELISSNVFEVIVPKKENPQIVFEKELPFDKLPYQFRIDEYFSIGSAFRVAENRFLSAAHVFGAENDTFFADFKIRDRNGTIFNIKDVYKYSNDKDLILFSIEESEKFTQTFDQKPFLELSDEFIPASKVYTVGNAFGEGIVIRDGLLTSMTPEAKNGRWKWLRFSA
ncbi:MAG: serine protease, partial [Spirochaetales bacterium]|nr:serine protease [Spirochaetales bacterium]